MWRLVFIILCASFVILGCSRRDGGFEAVSKKSVPPIGTKISIADNSKKVQATLLKAEALLQLLQSDQKMVTLNGLVIAAAQLQTAGKAVVLDAVCELKGDPTQVKAEGVYVLSRIDEDVVQGQVEYRRARIEMKASDHSIELTCMRASRTDDEFLWVEINKSLGSIFKIEFI